jgi:hypothetical protein
MVMGRETKSVTYIDLYLDRDRRGRKLNHDKKITYTTPVLKRRKTKPGAYNNIHCAGVKGAGYYIQNIE